MKVRGLTWLRLGAFAAGLLLAAMPGLVSPAQAQAPAQKPNILFIMGDDGGWFNIGAYHRGIMAGKTPNLDQLAAEGMLFTDLRRGELYCRTRCLHHRRAPDPHGPDHSRS